MTLPDFLLCLQESPVGIVVGSWPWVFPNLETLHVLSLTTVFGSILMVDVRLLGLAEANSRISVLSQEVLPYTWIAFLCAVITGTLLFSSKAQTYFYNLQFQLKFACMALAGINMAVFHLGVYRRVLEWDTAQPPPIGARIAGALSIVLWTATIFFGRWTGFTT